MYASSEVLHDEAADADSVRELWVNRKANNLRADELREPYIEAVAGIAVAEEIVWCLTELNEVINELVSNASFSNAISQLDPMKRVRATDALRELLRAMPNEMKRRFDVAHEVADSLYEEPNDD